MLTLSELRREAAVSTAEAFAQRYQRPILVLRSLAEQVDAWEPDNFKTRHFQTPSLGDTLRQAAPGEQTLPPLGTVYLVEKGLGRPYPDRITVGRTKTNDVVLALPGISKLHAYFTWSADRATYFVTDADATNGTQVDGKPATPGVPVLLRDATRLTLGPYEFSFLRAAALHAFLLDKRQTVGLL
jgi:hypothetical protein